MKKLLLVCLLFVVKISIGQVYQIMPQYGYEVKRMSFDSTLQIPTVCGVPTLKSNVLKKAAIAFDSCNNRFYQYNPKTASWSYLGSGGGGSQDLQSVTDNGATTTNTITITDNLLYSKLSPAYTKMYYNDGFEGDSTTIYPGYIEFHNLVANEINKYSYHNNNAISWADYSVGGGSLIQPIQTSGTHNYALYHSAGNSIDTLATLSDVRASSGGSFVPYTGATQDVDLGTNKISAHSVYVTGTNGNGHIHLKHQSSDATATGQSTSLFADSNGDLKWKNDGNYYTTLKTSTNTADRIYTFPNSTTTLLGSSDTSSLSNRINFKLNSSDTSSLSSRINLKVNISDTSTMLSKYLRKTDTATLSNRINLKVNISDTASMLTNYAKTSSVNLKVNISDTASMLTNYVKKDTSAFYLINDATTTNTTATNTNLTFSVGANETYRIMVAGTASKATTTTGVKIAIGAPTGATLKGVFQGGGAAASTALTNQILSAPNTLLASAFATGAGVEVPFRFEGVITTSSTTGSIILQFATVTSNTATIYAGTLMQLIKIKGL